MVQEMESQGMQPSARTYKGGSALRAPHEACAKARNGASAPTGLNMAPGCCRSTPLAARQPVRSRRALWICSWTPCSLSLSFALAPDIVDLLGHQGRPAEAEALVGHMEASGVPGSAAVLASLARVMCRCGRWQDAVSLVSFSREGLTLVEDARPQEASYVARTAFAMALSCFRSFNSPLPAFCLATSFFLTLFFCPSTPLVCSVLPIHGAALPMPAAQGVPGRGARSPQQ